MQRIHTGIRGLDWAFIRGSSFNSLGIAISRVLGFAFSFVIAQAFSTEEFGRVTYVITLASVVAVFSQPFGQHVLGYFIGTYRDDAEKRQEILKSAWTIWLGVIVLTLLTSTVILQAIDRFSVGLLVVYIGITAFYTYYGISSGFLASGRLLAVYLGSNIVQIILVVIAVNVFHTENGTPAIFIYGLAYFLPLAVLLLWYPFPIRLSFGFNLTNVRRILRFSVPIWMAHLLYMAYVSSDIIVLEHFMSASAVGVYALTKTLSSAFHFIPGGITMILMPKLAGIPKESHGSFLKVSLLVTVGVNLIGGILYMALYQWFIVTFFGAEYFVDMSFALIMALAAILFGTHGVFTAYFVGGGRVSIQVISRSIMMVSILALSVTLIPEHGVMGAAVANLVSVVCGVVFYVLVLIYNGITARSTERASLLSPSEQ